MDKSTVVFGKKVVGRKETIEYIAKKFNWQNIIIGISAYFGFWAWIYGRLTKRKVIYYCIDFYSPKIAKNLWDRVFIWAAMQMDKLLVEHCDKIWDISERINEGRAEFGAYWAKTDKIVPLVYSPRYFRYRANMGQLGGKEGIQAAYVGLEPYGLELFNNIPDITLKWIGKGKMPLEELLTELAYCDFGVSMWEEKGNNYYGDPGKTKLYSACGLPVIMTDNTPYAKIIKETMAGIVCDYSQEAVKKAVKEMILNYDFYKRNVKKTWEYINADGLYRHLQILEF